MAPALERLDVCVQGAGHNLELPALPNLRALHVSRFVGERLCITRAPRLLWVLLDDCPRLLEVSCDSPELVWLGMRSKAKPRMGGYGGQPYAVPIVRRPTVCVVSPRCQRMICE